ncbi:SRPBCC family protein [Natrononativus amylolyticus]|uniref:SRPBCC family protein n=1 Tax=Natrononativus amylolyticus TaxID=2963434 RepID=UPI0020CD5AC7|nr:SRPBCC family protein [Natrononativus amylolyticus]
MQLVDLEVTLDIPPSAVREALTPASIVEYAGTYEVVSVDRTDDATVVTAAADDLEVVFEFVETDTGYRYEQHGAHGPFERMTTWISVTREAGETRVSAASEFTFGGLFSFLTDRLGATMRRRELERLLTALALDLEA